MRLTCDAYATPLGDWRTQPAPRRITDRWRAIQRLAAPGNGPANEARALDELASYLDDWEPAARGAGYGAELVLAIDLALRHGRADLLPGWLERHGHRFARERFLLEQCLCLPQVATAMVAGRFRRAIGLSVAAVTSAMDAMATAHAASARPDGG
jgi:hypothetical protein